MNKQYYYIDPQGVRQGPLPLSSIPRELITPTTKVWTKGMDAWTDAIKVPDFAPFWTKSAPSAPRPTASSKPQVYQATSSVPNESKKALYTSLAVVGGFLLIILIGVGIFFLSSNKDHHSSEYAATDSVVVDSITDDRILSDTIEADNEDSYATSESEEDGVNGGMTDNSEKHWTFTGYFVDASGKYPIRLSFLQKGEDITDCVYTNVKFGGKIHMQGVTVNNGEGYVLHGKDGRNDFSITFGPDEGVGHWAGSAQDGNKEFDVYLTEE